MNWASTIPLVSAFAAVFAAGVAWTRLAVMDKRMDEMKKDLADAHSKSAESQGARIGRLEDKVGTLLDWRTDMKAAQRERSRIDTRGVPIQGEDP